MIDINPVEAMLHVVGPTLTDAAAADTAPPGRLGSRMDGAAMRNVFATADGHWVAISVSTARQLSSLAALVGAPTGTRGPDLEEAVRVWLASRCRADALEQLAAARLPAAPVNTAGDVATDPHMLHRRALRRLRTPDGRIALVPAATPRAVEDAGSAAAAGNAAEPAALPAVGEHTAQVLAEWTAAAGRGQRESAVSEC